MIQVLNTKTELSKNEREQIIGAIFNEGQYLIAFRGINDCFLVLHMFVFPYAYYEIEISDILFLN
jgi:hypothetical protein